MPVWGCKRVEKPVFSLRANSTFPSIQNLRLYGKRTLLVDAKLYKRLVVFGVIWGSFGGLATKTKYVLFSQGIISYPLHHCQFHIDNIPHVKFLSIYIDKHLNWNNRVDYVTLKIPCSTHVYMFIHTLLVLPRYDKPRIMCNEQISDTKWHTRVFH